MTRLLVIFTFCLMAVPVSAADPPPPLAEKFLHDGKFAEGETASLLALDADAKDDEVRFGLGAIQFVRAVENLGKALYEYGAVSEKATQPFLRLPVPRNESPSAVSYRALGRVLDAFAVDLGRAEATLAGIKDDQVKLRLRLAKINFDFAGTGKDRTTLIDLLTKLNRGRFNFQKANPEFRVHFDRGDVAWLRAYCHLLSAMVEGYRAVDEEAGFGSREGHLPQGGCPGQEGGPGLVPWAHGGGCSAPAADAAASGGGVRVEPRDVGAHPQGDRRRFRVATEPEQTDQLGLPLTDERIDRWLAMMAQLEGLLKGERLVSSDLLNFLPGNHANGMGLNLKKLLDDPPADLLNLDRMQAKGIDAKYLEPEKGRKTVDLDAVQTVIQLFDGPFGFAYAARFN